MSSRSNRFPSASRVLMTTALLWGVSFSASAAPAPLVEVFKSPHCGCCGKWVEHMRAAGFNVKVTEVQDVVAQRERLRMPSAVGSCHTASVAGYALEGHIPAADVKRLLKEKPKGLGIAVPGMPPGSPGMEGMKPASYETLLVKTDGSTTVFEKH